MKKLRPKIGLLLFQSQWFKDVGLTSGGEGTVLHGDVVPQVEALAKMLSIDLLVVR